MPNREFVISESNGSWNVCASQRRIVRQCALLFYVGAAILAGGVLLDYSAKGKLGDFGNARYFFTIVGCLGAIVFVSCGIWIWQIRNISLSIDTKSGEVHLGNRLLCGEGTVQSVVLKRPSNLPEEQDNYFIEFKLKDHTTVDIPVPLFVAIGNFESAFAIAAEIAARLNVDVCRDF